MSEKPKVNTPAEIVRHELETLSGLYAFDGAAPNETWRFSSEKGVRALDELLEVNEKLEGIAQFLFSLLDDIDTAEDAVKSDDKAFREYARQTHQRRFEVASTNGYKVWWTPGENAGPPKTIPPPEVATGSPRDRKGEEE